MNKITALLIYILFAAINPPVFAVDNWKVITIPIPDKPNPMCAMESIVRNIHDGQTETKVKLIYTEQALYAETESHIDQSYPELGIKIDAHSRHEIDRIEKKNNAVFDKNMKALRSQLLSGKRVRLSLGFWPTWPKTKTRFIEFSLTGFGKIYRHYQACQNKNGAI